MDILKEKDATELAALEASCFSTAWGAEKYREILRYVEEEYSARNLDGKPFSPAFFVLGIRSSEQVLAGYISLGLHHAAGELEVYNIAIRQTCRGRGLGRALLDHALQTGRHQGLKRAVLEVRTGNTAARALYLSAGFHECGRRKKYYADTGEDALVLALALNKPIK